MPPVDVTSLLLVAALGVALVVLLITWVRIPAFIALAAGSFFVGLGARMPLADIPRAFQQGVGDTLGFIAMVVGLGTVIGKLLAESGGAVVVSRVLVGALGEKRLDWAMLLSGFLIGLPVFFQVGLVLLAPVLFTAIRQTGTPMLRLGIPLIAGLSVSHGLVPPHPGPLAAIERLGADTGRTLFYSLIIGLPVAMAAGPMFGRFISRRVHVDVGGLADQLSTAVAAPRTPSLAITLMTILMPVLLMLLAALAQATLADGPLRQWLAFAGSPLVAMLLAALLALYTFGTACGFDRGRLLRFAEESVPPIAGVLLVVGAGGGFGRVLDAAGVDTAIAQSMSGMQTLTDGAWLGGRRVAACVGGIGHRGDRHRREHHGPDRDGHARHEQGSARHRDWRRLAHRESRQRRWILAREGVLQHEHLADGGDMDRPRDHRLGPGPRGSDPAGPDRVEPLNREP